MMTMRKLAAKMLECGKPLLADAALDLDIEGVMYEDLLIYALQIGVSEGQIDVLSDDAEVLDSIVALEQQCQFS
jgi:hypothetical protein